MGVVCNLTAYEVGGSINVANNSTNVYVKLTATTSGASYNNYSPSGTITINGTIHSYSHNLPKSSTVTLYEATHTITHNSDGTKSIGISYSFNTGISAGTLTGSQTIVLSTVPRASSVTCADGNIGSATTININRASSGFTHTLKYSFGGLNGTVATKTGNTSVGWIIPTSFYTKIPNATNGQGTITCETYNGDMLIGTSTCSFNAFVINSDPTISATVIDVNETTKALTGDANKLVKYYSNAKVTITATAKDSATIKSQKVVCEDGKTSTSATSTLNAIESNIFNISCTDSRGFSANAKVTKTLINYIKLAFTEITLSRPSTTSNTINAIVKGNYFNASFGSVANTLILKWRWRIQEGAWSSYTTITATKSGNTFSYNATLGTNFSFNNGYEFEFVTTDKLATVTSTKTVSRGLPIVDIGKDDVKVNGTVHANKFNNYSLAAACARGVKTLTSKGTIGWGTNNNYLPDLGMMAYWNGAYINTNSNLTYCYQGEIQAKPKNLYNNASGTAGTVTLSENAANFTYLEIFYFDNNNCTANSIKVVNPNGKNIGLFTLEGSTRMYARSKNISINGVNITNLQYAFANFSQGNYPLVENTNYIKIYHVNGYR